MKFELNPEIKQYLESRGKVILNACPGSGKTTTVAYKLNILTDECFKKYSNYSGIACLSFTNVAKDEITSKYSSLSSRRLSYPHVVSTIDSFINKYITLPFYYLLEYNCKRPNISNSVDFLDDVHLGWFPNKRKQPLKVSYKPSKLRYEASGEISWNGKNPNPKIVDEKVFERFSKKFKGWQFENGYLNNDDSTYIALKLLRRFPQIGKNLVNRFPYIIIDEAQDTSELQYLIFDELIKYGLENIEYVGDPYQSLYEFRQARPDLFLKKYEDSDRWNALELTACRRSSQRIVDFYKIFRKDEEKSIKSVCTHSSDEPIRILKYDEDKLDQLINEYIKCIDGASSYQILVRGKSLLELFGVQKNDSNPWKNDIAKQIINAKYNFEIGKIKDCINELRKVYVELHYSELDFNEKSKAEIELREKPHINSLLYSFIKLTPSLDQSLIDWTSRMTELIKDQFGVEVDLQLKQKGKRFYALNLKELLFPKAETNHPITTIHKVKGMTYSSILLVLSENSSGEKISLSDITSPKTLPNEKQRMIYVALSRPEKLACIAIPKTISNKTIEEKLNSNVDIIEVD